MSIYKCYNIILSDIGPSMVHVARVPYNGNGTQILCYDKTGAISATLGFCPGAPLNLQWAVNKITNDKHIKTLSIYRETFSYAVAYTASILHGSSSHANHSLPAFNNRMCLRQS